MSANIDVIIGQFKQNPIDLFYRKYQKDFNTAVYSSHINGIIERWRENLDLPVDSDLIQLAKSMVLAPPQFADEGVVNEVICLLKAFKGNPCFEDSALLVIKRILEEESIEDACEYQDKCSPLVWKVFESARDEGLLRPERLDPQLIHEVLQLSLNNNRKDAKLADALLALDPKASFINATDRNTSKTLLQKFVEEDSEESEPFGVEYLLAKGADVNLFRKGTTPVLITCAKNLDKVLLKKLKERKDLDMTVTDHDGKGAYFHLISGFYAPSISLYFKPSTEGLDERVTHFLDPIKLREFRLKEHEVPGYLDDFVKAWTHTDPVHHFALSQATLVFLKQLGTYESLSKMTSINAKHLSLPNCSIDSKIELFKLIKEEFYFESALFTFISKISSESAYSILYGLKGCINKEHPPKRLLCSMIFDNLNEDGGYDKVADILFELYPDLAKEPFKTNLQNNTLNESMLRTVVKQGRPHAVSYLLDHGAEPFEKERLLNEAVLCKNVEIIQILLQHDYNVNDRDELKKSPLSVACLEGDLPIVRQLLEAKELDPSIVNREGRVAIQIAFKARHFEVADLLFRKFGTGQCESLHGPYNYFLTKIAGMKRSVSKEEFLTIAEKEIERVREEKKGYPFDKRIFKFVSNEYESFWSGFGANNLEVNPETISSALEKSSLSGSGLINFIQEQFQLYKEMQRHSRLKDFPIQNLWRFAVDASKEHLGPCVFEDEPGYLKGFFQGMHFALKTAGGIKNKEWYKELHQHIVDGVHKPYSSWELGCENLDSMTSKLGMPCQFGIKTLDQDPLGVKDLVTRNGGPAYQFLEETQTIRYPTVRTPEYVNERLNLVLNRFNALLPETRTRAQKLLLFLWTSRELEIEHVFNDANGRASHLALLSMIAGEDSLPMFLLPDPNILDGNGPESLAARYLEACVNFRHEGIGHSFEASKEVKKLDSIELLDEDLITLREELRPWVENMSWKDALFSLEKSGKNEDNAYTNA